MRKSILILGILALVIMIPAAFAHEEGEALPTIDTILGFTPIQAAIGITIIGIGFRTFIGMSGKPIRDFNVRILAKSGIVAFFASLTVVITSIQYIPVGIDDLGMLAIITGEIATVMGIDAGIHSASKRLTSHKDSHEGGDEGIQSFIEDDRRAEYDTKN